jgi:hypothetical protein
MTGPGYRYGGPQFESQRPRTESHNQLLQAQQILDQARQEAERARQYRDEARRLMSRALWCDPGDHAYSAKDPDQNQFERKYRDPETQEEKSETVNVCGAHMSEVFNGALSPMTPDQRRIRALEHDTGLKE